MQNATVGNLEPRTVAASQGWAWIEQGFGLFKRAPGPWIGTLLIWFLIYFVAALIPLGGLVTTLLGAVFQAGWMLGCNSLESGGEMKVEHLFAGFKGGQTGQLILVSALYLGGFIVIALVVGLLVGGSLLPVMLGKMPAEALQFGFGFALACLLAVALMIPLAMAMWFAPALVVFNNQPAFEAMKLSLIACWRNFVPFLVYGLVMMLLAVLAAIPLVLGFLVLGQGIIASIYTSYRDIFAAPAAPAQPAS